MNLKDTPIQRKLMSVIMLTSAVVLSLMCVAYMLLEYFTFRANIKSKVETIGSIIASNSSAALAFQSVEDANAILNALDAERSIVFACLYDINGNIFAQYPNNTSRENFPQRPQPGYNYRFEKSSLIGFHPIIEKNHFLGTLYIQSNMDAMFEQMNRYAIIGLLLISVSLIVAYILSKLLQKSISDPILALKKTATQISERYDFNVRAKKYGNDEVGELTDAFNVMLNELHVQNEEIKLFNQNLEHKVEERTHAIQQQKEFIETIIDASVDLIAVFDLQLNFIMLNKRYDELYDSDRTEVVGRNFLEVYPKLKNSSMHSNLLKALAGETIHDYKYKSVILNKTFENFYIPLKNNINVVYGVLAIGHDITNVMEANEKLEKLNQELIKSNRDLEQFAYVASHDLQEPLRKIQTFTQLLGGSVNDKQSLMGYHDKIKQSAFRMQQLIQDVLNFSKISNSSDAIVATDLNTILNTLKTDYELLIREKDASIIHPELPTIKGIPLQIAQMFSNLISNSLKYNDKKPVITLNYEKLSFEEIPKHEKLRLGGTYLKFKFKDNGIGFDPQFSEQIFNIFQRLHGKQAYSGTGIGLALCKKIVENHQGVIYAHGEPGVGSEFTIILPE